VSKEICIPCEREKAKLPKYREIAKQRALTEKKIIIVYLDEEDKKFRLLDLQTAKNREIDPLEYFLY
jgi:hypothetical protein